MASYNKVILMGNLTRDPQLSYLPSQTPVCEIGLAVNRKWRGQDGQMKEAVCFVDCRAFGKQGETINQYLRKGRPILIEGHLDLDQWEAQDGTKRSKHRVTIERFTFVDSGGGGGGGGSYQNAPAQSAAPPQQAAPPPSQAQQAPPMGGPQPPPGDFEAPQGEHIPF